MNQIVFAVNDKYVALLSAAIRSLLSAAATKVAINVIYSKLSKANIYFLTRLCNSSGCQINFYTVDESHFEGLPERGHLKVEAYYRLAIPNLINVDKALYLDCDILVTSDLSSLFALDIADYPIAAVGDPVFQPITKLGMREGAEYFNSGVMVLNLDYWRSHLLAQKTLEYLRINSEKITYADQCALNAIVNGNFLRLDKRFNFQVGHFDLLGEDPSKKNHLPHIIHFTGSVKPTNYQCTHPYKHLFLMELSHTPYYYNVKFLNFARFLVVNLNLYPFVNFIRKHLSV